LSYVKRVPIIFSQIIKGIKMVRKYLRLPDASEVAVEGRSFTLNKYKKETLIDILSQIGLHDVSNLKKNELVSLLIENLTAKQMYEILRCNGHSAVRTDLGKPVFQIILTTEQPMHYYGKKKPAIPKYCHAKPSSIKLPSPQKSVSHVKIPSPQKSVSPKNVKLPSPQKSVSPKNVKLPSPQKSMSPKFSSPRKSVRHGPAPFERKEPLPLLPPSPVLKRINSTRIKKLPKQLPPPARPKSFKKKVSKVVLKPASPIHKKDFIPRVKDHICIGCYRFSDILKLLNSKGYYPPTGLDKSDLIRIITSKFSKSDLVALLRANGVKDASVNDTLIKLRSQLSGGKFGQVCTVCELNTLSNKGYQLKLAIP